MKKDPKTVARFKKALAEARKARTLAIAGAGSVTAAASAYGRFNNPLQNSSEANIARVTQEQDANVAKLEDLYARVLYNEANPIDKTGAFAPRNYATGGVAGSNQREQYFLGGVGKFIGKAAKIAVPIAASFIPGVGGIASSLAYAALNSGEGAQQQVTQGQPAGYQTAGGGLGGMLNAASGDLNSIDKEEVSGMIQTHADNLHKRQTTASGSIGGGFRRGGFPQNAYYGGPQESPRYTTNGERQYAHGGVIGQRANTGRVPLGAGQAVEFVGPSHEQGGIPIGNNGEVEGGETMDFVSTKGGNVSKQGVPYIFSKAVKVPGSTMSFANYHKQMVKRGGSPEDITRLASRQEKVTGRSGESRSSGEFAGGGVWDVVKNYGGKALNFLNDNAGEIAALAPSFYNVGQGLFGSTESAQMQQIQAQQIQGPDRADFGPSARGGLDALGRAPNLRLNYQDAFAANNAALRTGTLGMGTAGKLAGLGMAFKNSSDLRADKTRSQDLANFSARNERDSQRASLTAGYDLADAARGSQFASLQQYSRQFNASSRDTANRFNVGADFQNEQGRLQAQAAKQGMLQAGITGFSDFAQNQANFGAQRDANKIALSTMFGSSSPETQAKFESMPWYRQMMGLGDPKTKIDRNKGINPNFNSQFRGGMVKKRQLPRAQMPNTANMSFPR